MQVKAEEEKPSPPVPAKAEAEAEENRTATGEAPDEAAAGDAVSPPSPPSRERAEEDEDLEAAERHRLLRAWINDNWDAVMAMAREGLAPQRPAPPPPSPAPAAVRQPRPVHVAKADRWNKFKMARFLRELAATHSVTAAARSVGMSRESAHRLRNRLKGQPFDVAWEAASRHGYDALADAALDRALNGVEVPHYANGELVGTHRKYNEQLTVALLKMRNGCGAPAIGRYGAMAEWLSERWDAALERVETGSVDWTDEREGLGPEELAALGLPSEKTQIDALIEKHAPDWGHKPPSRK